MKCVFKLLPGFREPCLPGTVPPKALRVRRARLAAARAARTAGAALPLPLPPPPHLFLLN